MKSALALIASLIAVAGYVPYLRDAFTRRVKPHPYTWLVWTIVSTITFAGQVVKGAGPGALPTAMSALFSLAIFLLALRYGFRNIRKVDNYFLVIALAGLIPWLLTDDPTISVVIAVSIDLIAFVPTIRKAWHNPRTETPILYGANVVRHILALCALDAYNIATTLHSIAMIIANSIMTGIILLKKPFDDRKA